MPDDDQLTAENPTLAADPHGSPPVVEDTAAPPADGQPPAAASSQPPPGTQLPPPAPWVQQPPTGVYPQYPQPPTGVYPQFQQQPPTGIYPQYQQTPTGVHPQYQPPQPVAPGYGPPPAYGQPPVQPPGPLAPQGAGGGGQRGLIIALAGLIATLLIAAGVAIVLLVASGDEPAKPVAQKLVVTPQPPAATVTARARPKAKPKRTRRATTRPRSRPAAVAPSTPTSSATSAGVDRQSIKSMLSRHFADIERGNLSSAFADLAPSLGQSEGGWTSDIRADGLYSHSISVAPQITSSTSGLANIVNFHTEASASGCKDWSGSWNVLKTGGRWQISKSNLSQTVVNCGE